MWYFDFGLSVSIVLLHFDLRRLLQYVRLTNWKKIKSYSSTVRCRRCDRIQRIFKLQDNPRPAIFLGMEAGAPGTPSSSRDGVTSVFTPSSRHLKPQQKGSHHRVRSIGDWVKQAMSPSSKHPTEEALTPQQVVKKVEEERVSRKLFSTSLVAAPNKAASRKAGDMMIEFFALVSCGRPEPVVEMTWPECDYPRRIHFFSQFCLPYLLEEQMQARDDEFVFFISSENNSERLVCVCAVVGAKSSKTAALQVELAVSSRAGHGHRRSLSSGDAASTSVTLAGGPKCFVLVSKFPFVPVLLHVVRGLAAHQRATGNCSETVMRECVNRLLVPLPEVDETLLAVTPAGEMMQWRKSGDKNRCEYFCF